jgi:hypothetical protein
VIETNPLRSEVARQKVDPDQVVESDLHLVEHRVKAARQREDPVAVANRQVILITTAVKVQFMQ